jgi:hypothetical protein
VNLDFRGTCEVLAAEQDGGLERVVSRPGIVSIAEGMLKTLQHPIQVQAQIAVSFDRFSGRERLEVQVVVVGWLSAGAKIDFFNLGRASSGKKKSSFIDFSDSKKRIRTRTVLRPLEFSAPLEKAFLGGLQQLIYTVLENVRSRGRSGRRSRRSGCRRCRRG